MKTLILVLMLFITNTSFAQKNNTMENKNTHSVEIIRYKVPAGQHKDFEDAYAAGGKHLQESPYCLFYEVVKGVEEPDRYIVRIHWTSREDHEKGFRQSSQFRGFFNYVRPYFNNIEEMKHYEYTAVSWKRP